MDDWFSDLAEVPDPGREHLARFVREVMRLLAHVLETDAASVLWELNPELREMARGAFESDVQRGAEELLSAIPEVPERALVQHGLTGRAARFKYNVMAAVSRGWGAVRDHFTIGGGFKRVVEAIDAHLDSLIAVTGGVGGVVKEFKDALMALAPER
ncbi:MAG: hypothetical protein KIT09_04550 [Bryobacteraceae bacterium]|nr:hypothetical protein [Bryobacteraceae bacterium]